MNRKALTAFNQNTQKTFFETFPINDVACRANAMDVIQQSIGLAFFAQANTEGAFLFKAAADHIQITRFKNTQGCQTMRKQNRIQRKQVYVCSGMDLHSDMASARQNGAANLKSRRWT